MSTPLINTVPTTDFTLASGNDGALQSGVKWGIGYGIGVALTYSFPDDNAWFVDGYSEFNNWYALNAPEKAAVKSALSQWSSVANITFVEVPDNKTVAGELRFALTDNAGNEAAHAYYPSHSPEGGDVWFKNGEWHTRLGSEIKPGSYDYLTALHEIGHAIGLKHPFEGPQKLQKAYDNYAFTIMSYSASAWGDKNDNYASFYPTTPMYYDLVNIQGMYGRGVHNSGDTVYSFKDGQNYWQTIDDSGGTDTIVHKGSSKAIIDLGVGHWSALGNKIHFTGSSTKWTVAIGPDTAIENAIGGAGKDKVIGNSLANTLAGGKGKDLLIGGAAQDSFLFNTKPSSGNVDTIKDFTAGVDLIKVAQDVFTALSAGALTAQAFDAHFDYTGGVLAYDGKAIAKLAGAPAIDEGDLWVV